MRLANTVLGFEEIERQAGALPDSELEPYAMPPLPEEGGLHPLTLTLIGVAVILLLVLLVLAVVVLIRLT